MSAPVQEEPPAVDERDPVWLAERMMREYEGVFFK